MNCGGKIRREPARPSERRSEGAGAECVWAAAIAEYKRVRVAVGGAELTACSFVRHGARMLVARRCLSDVRECATRASCTLTGVQIGEWNRRIYSKEICYFLLLSPFFISEITCITQQGICLFLLN